MNKRLRAFWLPGLVMGVLSMGLLLVCLRLGFQPLTFFLHWHHPWQFYLPWLAMLPLLGALGAYPVSPRGRRDLNAVGSGAFPSNSTDGFGDRLPGD
jgi:hypothetical protein